MMEAAHDEYEDDFETYEDDFEVRPEQSLVRIVMLDHYSLTLVKLAARGR